MSYQEKLQAKRNNCLAKAEKAEQESQRYCRKAVEGLEVTNGQPILVGHHSEKKHRRLLKQSDTNMQKSVEEKDKAEHYRQKAESIGKGGISSDDENAMTKLQDKLVKLSTHQETMKKANRQFKKGGWDAVDCLSDKQKAEAMADKAKREGFCPHYDKMAKVFPSFELSNNNAKIKSTQARIKELQALRQFDNVSETYSEFEYLIDDNRVQFIFMGKPENEVRSILKSYAFLWSPNRGAWVRKLTSNALFSASIVKKKLLELGSQQEEGE